MISQQTLVIVKPDGMAKGLVGLIINSLCAHDLTVVDSAKIHLDKSLVKQLYAGEERESYFQEVVNWVSSAPVLFLRVSGYDAVAKVKWKIIGKYPEGIRGQYSENQIKNVVHSSDSLLSAKRELRLAEQIFARRQNMDAERFKGKMIFALTGMSECGKSTAGKYLDSKGIPRLKIIRLFGQVCNKLAPSQDLKQFIAQEEQRDPYALWDSFINELLEEMEARKVTTASIESLYGGGLGPYLQRKLGSSFCIVYIDAPEEKRLEFQMIREGLSDIGVAKHLMLSRDKIKAASGIPKLKEIAGEIIDNTGTLEDLYRNVDTIIAKYRSR